MKIRYIGTDKEVKFAGEIFKRGEWKDVYKNIELPFNFESDKKKKIEWFDKLSKIKGISKETVKDIKRIYNSEKELITALKKDKVPLRNDKVILLKKYFGVD